MKILMLSTYDLNGGAAIATSRLMQALNKYGHEVKMLVANKTSNNTIVFQASTIFNNKAQKINLALEKGLFLLHEKNNEVRYQFSTAVIGFNIRQNALLKWADVIHLHWTLQGFLSIREMAYLQTLGKPVVWTLHDMWAFTGGCHYSGDCDHFKRECGNCPYLKHPSSNDLSHKIYQKKKNYYKNYHFVTCSQWLGEVAKTSTLLKGFGVESIANPIDTNVFKPAENKNDLKLQLKLDPNKSYVLFGASSLKDKRKGLHYFLEAMKLYQQKTTDLPTIILYGSQNHDVNIEGFEIIHAGFLNESELIAYYQVSDIYVITSLEDNLPNTVMEAIACGLPVLSFDTGGIPQMVQHLESGYIAKYKSVEDICEGLDVLLNSSDLYQMSQNARNYCLDHFTEEIISQKYTETYNRLLNRFDK
ncbi:MAG TPA: glycosyltransferase [Chitinophagales bacterium]|nr:glycosyltransferase [Chitinophagales bacterium]